MAQAWYPMTYRSLPLPPPVAAANRLHVQNQALNDEVVDEELRQRLSECGADALSLPRRALDGWEDWAAGKRAAVAATLGETPSLRVVEADVQLPVRSEATGTVRLHSLRLAGGESDTRTSFDVIELAAASSATAPTAVVVLPELEPSCGLGRRSSTARWMSLREAGASVFLPDPPVLGRAYNASCKAMLVSGTTFLAQLLAETAAVVGWLRREKGFGVVSVAGEGPAALVALLAAALLPGVDGCVLAEPPEEALWPLDTMLVLPDARITMTPRLLAALVPPRGMLVLDGVGSPLVRAASASATLYALAGKAAATASVAAVGAVDVAGLAAWVGGVAHDVGHREAVLGPETRFAAVTKAQAAPTLRDRYLAIIGRMPPPSPLAAWTEPIKDPDYPMERVYLHSEADVVVPGVFLKPTNAEGRLPVVLALPGSSSTDLDVALPWGRPLLERGFAVFAVDAKASRHAKRAVPYSPEVLERGATALGEMTYDLIRALDYLETRADVDMGRIGAFGISQGGTWTWMLAAADERVKVSVPVVGVATYRTIMSCLRDESMDSTFASCLDSHSLYYYPPGLLQVGDQADFLALIAPRPLLILGMSRDNCFPQAGVVETSEALRQVYRDQGAEERFDYYLGEGPHSYPPELQQRVWDWMARWL